MLTDKSTISTPIITTKYCLKSVTNESAICYHILLGMKENAKCKTPEEITKGNCGLVELYEEVQNKPS